MPPIKLNRRRFLGCSAAATFSLSQRNLAESATSEASAEPIRLGLIGIGSRGTALLRGLLELPGASVVAVCDPDQRHRTRGQGIVEKACGRRPDAYEDARRVIERNDITALVVAVPCDLHEAVGCEVIQAGKHLYAEKPLALTLTGCGRLSALAGKKPDQVIHVGFQRRSNPRFLEGVELIKRGELGPLLEARAAWTSSNGPLTGSGGWLGQRDRSGDFMVEQAVHIWDVLHWLHGDVPVRATGWGRRGLFARQQPGRDVTDHYSVELEWADGFRASFFQSWIAPADDGFTGATLRVLGEDGGLDFGTGSLSFRDRLRPRQTIHPGPQNDTRLALLAFLTSIRATSPLPPPISLEEARAATLTGLLVRKAVDERRIVTLEEIRAESGTA
jgi:predicted dehydrogenase